MSDKIALRAVNTGKSVYITDCNENSGYYYNYHQSKIPNLYFDGEKASPVFKKNWYVVNKMPTVIQIKKHGEIINRRYEIKDKDMISPKLPAVIDYSDPRYKDEDGEFIYSALYVYKQDKKPDYMEDVEVEWKFIMDVENFVEPPKIKYEGIERFDFKDRVYTISNDNIEHQLLDTIVFPEILIHKFPCKFNSKQVYDITRQYVIKHINPGVAKITSNYDFCFEVKKLVKKYVPETIHYHNIFARTRKQREKIHTSIKEYEEYPIFNMTYSPKNYEKYTPIPEMVANNERELKEKMDNWLKYLIEEINRPLLECPHCNGTGIVELPKEQIKPN